MTTTPVTSTSSLVDDFREDRNPRVSELKISNSSLQSYMNFPKQANQVTLHSNIFFLHLPIYT